jgi:general secretion pathway protein L
MSVPIPESGEGSAGLRTALEAVAAQMDMDGTDCAVALPAVLFSCRNLHVPFPNPKKIRMMLPYEIESSLPYQADELAIDFSVLDGGPGKEETEVLAAAVERIRLDSFLADIAAAGIEPERVTLSGLSAAAWSGRNADSEAPLLFLDVAETFGAVFVVAAGRVRLIRSFPLPADARARRRALGNHMRTTLGAWAETAAPGTAPAEAVVIGEGLAGSDLEELAAALPISLRAADIGRGHKSREVGANDAPWDSARMDGALALALAEIEGIDGLNFHRGQFPGKKLFSRHRDSLMWTGALAAVVVVLMLANVITQGFLTNRRLADLDRQIAAVFSETFPEVKKVADPYQQMQISLQEIRKNAALPGETLPALRSIDVLKFISGSIPESIAVVIDRMVVGPESILISGSTGGFNAVDEIKGHLERVAGFKKVTISSANTDRTGKEVNFQLKVDL